MTKAVRATLAALLMLAMVPLASGCGAAMSTYLILVAQADLDGAEAAEADKFAPYEYTAAQEYLRKAREEQSYADFGPSIEYAWKAQELAEAGRIRAEKERKDSRPPGGELPMDTGGGIPPPAAAPPAAPPDQQIIIQPTQPGQPGMQPQPQRVPQKVIIRDSRPAQPQTAPSAPGTTAPVGGTAPNVNVDIVPIEPEQPKATGRDKKKKNDKKNAPGGQPPPTAPPPASGSPTP